MKNTVCTALMLLMSVCMYAQELYGEYEKKVYVSSQGDSLKYRLLRPEAEKAGKKYPLVLFLHGAGERGDDNQKQLVHGGQMWLNPVNREEYPAFVLAPQCPKEDYWLMWVVQVVCTWRNARGTGAYAYIPHIEGVAGYLFGYAPGG